MYFLLLLLASTVTSQQFHEPGTAPKARGPSPKRHHHQNIHLDLEEEREHIKAKVKTEYLDTEGMDDKALLMQYFRKHDTDNNLKLDGLELLKAIAGMDDDHHHDSDEGDPETGAEENGSPEHPLNMDGIIPIIDSILEHDDKNKDGYINWSEFISRQQQHMGDNKHG